MIKYKTSERRVDLYNIGDGLTLMNIILKNDEGKMQEVHSYIGQEGNGFSCVGHTEGLDEPEVVFSYSSYARMLLANLSTLLNFFYSIIGYVGVKTAGCQPCKDR